MPENDNSDELDTQVETQEEEYTAIEQQAMQKGWRPEGVEGKPSLTAEEFMGRQKLYDDLSSVKRQLRKQKEIIDELKQTTKLAREAEREKVLSELKANKRQALEDGDHDAVIEIDDRIAEVRATEQATQATPDDDPDFEEFIENNEWYNQNEEMKDHADVIGIRYFKAHPKASRREVYEYVANTIRERFTDEFGEETTRPAPAVETSKRQRKAPPASKKKTARDLPEDAREIMGRLVKKGVMTQEEYIEQFFG